jgi:hypothetical protein
MQQLKRRADVAPTPFAFQLEHTPMIHPRIELGSTEPQSVILATILMDPKCGYHRQLFISRRSPH